MQDRYIQIQKANPDFRIGLEKMGEHTYVFSKGTELGNSPDWFYHVITTNRKGQILKEEPLETLTQKPIEQQLDEIYKTYKNPQATVEEFQKANQGLEDIYNNPKLTGAEKRAIYEETKNISKGKKSSLIEKPILGKIQALPQKIATQVSTSVKTQVTKPGASVRGFINQFEILKKTKEPPKGLFQPKQIESTSNTDLQARKKLLEGSIEQRNQQIQERQEIISKYEKLDSLTEQQQKTLDESRDIVRRFTANKKSLQSQIDEIDEHIKKYPTQSTKEPTDSGTTLKVVGYERGSPRNPLLKYKTVDTYEKTSTRQHIGLHVVDKQPSLWSRITSGAKSQLQTISAELRPELCRYHSHQVQQILNDGYSRTSRQITIGESQSLAI